MEDNNPRKVIVKTMTANRSVDEVFDFFADAKSMEIGGAAKSVAKGNDGWWTFDHVTGKAKMKHFPARQAGVLDHVFVGAGLEWHVYVRIIPNQGGSTVIWAFVRPDGLSDEQFEQQLKMFDREINLWKEALESRQKAVL
jgi:hypothetical protein